MLNLAEVLVACGLLVVALALCGQLSGQSLRMVNHNQDRQEMFRQASLALDRFNRDLTYCTQIYSPASLTGNAPSLGNLLVLRTSNSQSPADGLYGQGNEVVGYRYDPSAQTLTRLLYDPAYDPSGTQGLIDGAPGPTPANSKVLAHWILGFRPQLLDPMQTFGQMIMSCQLDVSTVPPANDTQHWHEGAALVRTLGTQTLTRLP